MPDCFRVKIGAMVEQLWNIARTCISTVFELDSGLYLDTVQNYIAASKVRQLLTYTGHTCQCLMLSLPESASVQLYPAIHVHYDKQANTSQCHTT